MDEAISIYDDEDVVYEIKGYKLFELKDISRSWKYVFDDRERGGILVVDYLIENNRDEDIYYSPIEGYTVAGSDGIVMTVKQLVPEEYEISRMAYEAENIVAAGEEFRGYGIVVFKGDSFDTAIENGEMTLEPGYISLDSEDDSFKNNVVGDKLIPLPLSDKAKGQISQTGDLYPDQVIVKNLGTKTLLDEGEDLGTQTLEDGIDITIDGYQIAEFEPNADESRRYDGFKDGVILYTIKYTIENNSDQKENEIAFSSGYANLIFNESVRYMSDGWLEPETVPYDTVLKKGDSATGYYVFSISKDDYDMYEGRSVILDMTVMDKNYNAINDYQGLLFEIVEAD